MLAKARAASATPAISFVLSPWHFYELGSIEPIRANELLEIIEKLKPKYILDRADLQLAEFKQAWCKYWKMPLTPFVPIADLADIAGVLIRETPEKLARFTLGDYVNVFRQFGQLNLDPVLKDQQAIAAANQASVKAGKMTADVIRKIEVAYIAQQLARLAETGPSLEEQAERMRAILSDSAKVQSIRTFIDGNGMVELRAWKVESVLTDHHHTGTAKLGENRQVDRQHAVEALAYCDRLVTDDKELLKLCAVVAAQCPFRVAEAQSAETFLNFLH
jgi:hypothetical protein